jgi:small-conductance mechanosensitive channel
MKHIFEYELFHLNDSSFTIGNIILSFTVVVLNVIIVRIISTLIHRRFKAKPEETGRKFAIVQLIKYVLWIVAIIIALQALGFNITFIIASSTALLVGLGLGMQNIFKDFMSGLVLLVDGSIKVGDIVEVNGQVLKVKQISLRTSEVITRDDNILIVPNHKFTEENVINWTYNAAPTRFYIEVGVDYSSDLKVVEQCLLKSVQSNEDVLKTDESKPFVRFMNFGSSSLDFQLIFWSYNLFRIETTKSVIRYEIARLFKEQDITIPFTQIVLHQSPK